MVLVPFYRGAVVFKMTIETIEQFSSPFIEERLYLDKHNGQNVEYWSVLVPFYRGAVVFGDYIMAIKFIIAVLVPFYRGAVVFR